MENVGIETTNNANQDEGFSQKVSALRQSVNQRKIRQAVQSANGAICRNKLPTLTTSLRQQGRDVWEFLEQACIADHPDGVMPSLLPDR